MNLCGSVYELNGLGSVLSHQNFARTNISKMCARTNTSKICARTNKTIY